MPHLHLHHPLKCRFQYQSYCDGVKSLMKPQVTSHGQCLQMLLRGWDCPASPALELLTPACSGSTLQPWLTLVSGPYDILSRPQVTMQEGKCRKRWRDLPCPAQQMTPALLSGSKICCSVSEPLPIYFLSKTTYLSTCPFNPIVSFLLTGTLKIQIGLGMNSWNEHVDYSSQVQEFSSDKR